LRNDCARATDVKCEIQNRVQILRESFILVIEFRSTIDTNNIAARRRCKLLMSDGNLPNPSCGATGPRNPKRKI
jgi:hypothetical protein